MEDYIKRVCSGKIERTLLDIARGLKEFENYWHKKKAPATNRGLMKFRDEFLSVISALRTTGEKETSDIVSTYYMFQRVDGAELGKILRVPNNRENQETITKLRTFREQTINSWTELRSGFDSAKFASTFPDLWAAYEKIYEKRENVYNM
jgi:hypothetical protein